MAGAQLWLAATSSAALFQCWRTAKQQKLRGQLSVDGAGVVRYLYGVPVAGLYLAGRLAATGGEISALSCLFLTYTLGGRVAQIIATNLLIMSFSFRGFAVGTAYCCWANMSRCCLGAAWF
jgi:hypothetical protein